MAVHMTAFTAVEAGAFVEFTVLIVAGVGVADTVVGWGVVSSVHATGTQASTVIFCGSASWSRGPAVVS